MRLGISFIGSLALVMGCLLSTRASAEASDRCAMFDAAFERSTVVNVRLYGDRHGDLLYVVGCPEVNIGVRFGPGVVVDPANAQLVEYLRRESITSRRSATLDIIADFNPTDTSPPAPGRMLTIRKILRADLSEERNIVLFDEPSFP